MRLKYNPQGFMKRGEWKKEYYKAGHDLDSNNNIGYKNLYQ